MRIKVVLEPDREDGGFVVSVPILPGCHTQGKDREEALRNIVEAIQLYLDDEPKAPEKAEVAEVEICEPCARLREGVEVVCLRQNESLTFRKGDRIKLYEGVVIEGSLFIGKSSPFRPDTRALAVVLGPPRLEEAMRRDVDHNDILGVLSGELALPARIDHGEPPRAQDAPRGE